MGVGLPPSPVPRLDDVRQPQQPRRRRRLRCRRRAGLTIPARPAAPSTADVVPPTGRPPTRCAAPGGATPRPTAAVARPANDADGRAARALAPPSDSGGRSDRVANSSGPCLVLARGPRPTSLDSRPTVGGAPAARLRVRRCGTGGQSRCRALAWPEPVVGWVPRTERMSSSPVAACSHLCATRRRAARRAPGAFLSLVPAASSCDGHAV